jgi:hypothetical protein
MTQDLIKQLRQLPLQERMAVLVALAKTITGEAGAKLPPGPVAHVANLRHAANELQRVLRIDYGDGQN